MLVYIQVIFHKLGCTYHIGYTNTPDLLPKTGSTQKNVSFVSLQSTVYTGHQVLLQFPLYVMLFAKSFGKY